ncbi:MAG: SCO family protein [Phycisphaeraceae bacterium]
MDKRTIRAVGIIVIVAALAAVVATAGLAMIVGSRAAEPLPVFAEVPDFALTNQHGETVSRDALRGKVWIADFIFTRCRAICPMMTASLAQVRDELHATPAWDEVRVVSFSVDPEHDTPEVLREFASRYGADGDRWLFLTAERRETIWSLSRDGFMLRVHETPDNPAMPISHSAKFALVDRAGQIRGYYDSNDPEARAALVRDAQRLADE